MRNLFRSGAVFFIIAGISFLVAAGKYFLDRDSTDFPGALVVNALVMLIIGIAVRRKIK